jgi:diguanylate cyclase (GGDEF)-like protein
VRADSYCRCFWHGSVAYLCFAQQYAFRSYTQEDGLGNLSVTALAQDPSGFLWVGTENGLYRFDGSHFDRFGRNDGLEQTFVSALHVDQGGRLWVGTMRHLYLWDGHRLNEISYQGTPLPIWRGQHFTSLDRNHVVAVARERLYMIQSPDGGHSWNAEPFFSAQQEKALGQSSKIHNAYATAHGVLWMGCGTRICSWSNGEITQWGTDQGVPEEPWRSFLEDSGGTVWFYGNKHIEVLVPGSRRVQDRTPQSEQLESQHPITTLAEDRQHRVLAYSDKGVIRWDGNRWEEIGSANGLNVEDVSGLLADRDGDVWIGSAGGGLVHWLGNRNFENWTVQQGLPNETVWSLLKSTRGTMFLGTDAGLGQLEPTTPNRISEWKGAPAARREVFYSMVEDAQGNLWAGTQSGNLWRIDKTTGRGTIAGHLPTIFTLSRDVHGRIWIGTYSALYVVEHPEQEIKPRIVPEAMSAIGGDGIDISGGCESPSGDLWFLTAQGPIGLSHGRWIKPVVDGVPPPAHFTNLNCAKDGSLWAGGVTPGIWRLEPRGNRMTGTRLPVIPELASLRTMAVLQDRRGWLWVATDAGVAVKRGTDWWMLNQESGLVWPDCNQNALYEARDGSIWIGTSKGVSHVVHPETLFEPVALQPSVVGIEHNGQPLPELRTDGTRFSLPWSRGPLSFKLAIPSFLNRRSLRYRYRLVGLDNSWNTTTDAEIQYAQLPPGQYRLELVAENPTVQAVSSTAAVSFTILPPWWRTTICEIIEAVLASMAIWGLFRWRVRHLLAQRQKLERLVKLRTQELESEKLGLVQAREDLRVMATRDSLTKLYNRGAILEILDAEITRAHREGTGLVAVIADLDYFKRVNDTYGHLAGDDVLREAAFQLQEHLRSYDSVGRYGGEEFLIVMPNMSPDTAETRLSEMHRKITNLSVLAEQQLIFVTFSLGAAWLTGDAALSRSALLRHADRALYAAKNSGRNRVVWATPKPQ